MPKIIQGKFKILYNKKAGPDYFKMAICAPGIAQKALPGQFVHLRCQNSVEPLLRRPFSFHRINRNNFEILYKVVGRGTNLLAKRRKGDKIDVLGPLGNGFTATRSKIILAAGGMGVAPLLALAEKLADRKKIVVLLGAKTKGSVLCAGDFKKLGVKLQIATDDGSQGYKGLVTDLLKKLLLLRATHPPTSLGTGNAQRTTIYACGPKAMLKEIARISRRFRMPAYASLEEDMACGVGACLGCAVKTTAGYKRVCKDGPVFNLQEIKWS
ncbi:MAG: dihydroorotate dehydrogenase electron transfer subunit [Candidatus Omnitrophica bacterium]|nr:dihydroorotate dehydrogenase electron transfer subunit [Candidatus Omnitrophota bacterium]